MPPAVCTRRAGAIARTPVAANLARVSVGRIERSMCPVDAVRHMFIHSLRATTVGRGDRVPAMNDYVSTLMADVKAKNPAEPEFHQAVQEVADSLALVLERHPEYRKAKVLERIIEPERVLMFR